MKKMKYGIYSILILLTASFLAYNIYSSGMGKKYFGFKLGLDLSGGTELLYKADVSKLSDKDITPSLRALRDTIERRVNVFGVSEPVVQLEEGSALDKDAKHRLIVELPGVTDTQKAIDALGKTPVLEFRMQKEIKEIKVDSGTTNIDLAPQFGEAVLTGAHLKQALVDSGAGQGGIPEVRVLLRFNDEGKKLFAKFTKENVGKVFGIFLDGKPISTPVIRESIPGGVAVISGNFTVEEARELVRNLNFGALPVPIELLSTQTIGASLGQKALEEGIKASLYGLILVALFMMFWYRLPGIISVLSLSVYLIIMLVLFKYIPVTLTSAGIAGFILSLGMAVDANVLIFERMKEEIKKGKTLNEAIDIGFARAWPSIRDGNLSSLITAIILFWFGTGLIKGFALVFAIGILVSVVSAVYFSKTFLLALIEISNSKKMRALFKSGIK